MNIICLEVKVMVNVGRLEEDDDNDGGPIRVDVVFKEACNATEIVDILPGFYNTKIVCKMQH